MFYITGDTHGEFSRIEQFCERIKPTRDDTMIILGDAGINYYGGWRDIHKKQRLAKLPILAALAVSSHMATVRHVGSTAIKGMTAKPIIDIQICPNDDTPLEAVISDLERIGYKNLGDGGRTKRYFLSRGDKPNEAFYVHLCYEDHQVAKDQLLFKWIEAKNPIVRQKYTRLSSAY